MPLQANAAFVYTGSLVNADSTVTVCVRCALPGPDMPAMYSVTLTTAQVSSILAAGNNAQQLAALNVIVIAALIAANRPPISSIAASLALLPGQAFTVA